MTDRILNFINKKKLSSQVEIKSYKYDENHEKLCIAQDLQGIDDCVDFITKAIETKDSKYTEDLYFYMCNLSHNKITAFLFEELTGINPGKTNKSGEAAFIKFFGCEAPKKIVLDNQEIADARLKSLNQKIKNTDGVAHDFFISLGSKVGKSRKTLQKELDYVDHGVLKRMDFINLLIERGESVYIDRVVKFIEDPEDIYGDDLEISKDVFYISSGENSCYEITKAEYNFGLFLNPLEAQNENS